MSGTRICTTQSAGLRPLGQEGQRSWEMISKEVGDRLGPEHARLFAEPVASGNRAETDWYAAVPGRAVPLSDLPEDRRDAARRRLDTLRADIGNLADSLGGKGGKSNERLAEALRHALVTPGEDSVRYAMNADGSIQPVLVDWAREREDSPVRRGDISVLVQAAPFPFLPFAAGWLWAIGWLLLALILFAILNLLVAACGVRGVFDISFCPAPVVETVDETAALESRIRDLESLLADDMASCAATAGSEAGDAPETAPSRRTGTAPDPGIEDRLDRANAQRGDMNVALAWDTDVDLDLTVVCPDGARINYINREAASCGGALDVDIRSFRASGPAPVENVFFANPPPGEYRVGVHLFSGNAAGLSHPFVVQLRIGGEARRFSGVVDSASREWATTFQYGGPE